MKHSRKVTPLEISIIEITISLGILSIISTASVWLIFTSLALRDQALATTQTNESLRVFSKALAIATRNAAAVSGGGGSLFFTAPSECASFIYDQNLKNVRYARSTLSGCAPDPNPTSLFFPTTTQVTAMTFTITQLATGGRQTNASGTLQTIFPFNSYLSGFSETFTNVID